MIFNYLSMQTLLNAIFLSGIICSFTDDIAGTFLNFQINLSDILSENTNTHQLHTTDKADDAGHTCPACHRLSTQGLKY